MGFSRNSLAPCYQQLWTHQSFIFHALCAARSFLHCLSLEYFCALRYALNSHMLNMLCNNISCNVILCYIIYVMYVVQLMWFFVIHILDSHLWRCSASPSLMGFSCNSLALATSNRLFHLVASLPTMFSTTLCCCSHHCPYGTFALHASVCAFRTWVIPVNVSWNFCYETTYY